MNKILYPGFITVYFFSSFAVLGQQHFEVRGVVRDTASGEALAGASVVVKDNAIGTVTDKEGSFELAFSRDASAAVVVVRYVGYGTKEVSVQEGRTLLVIFLNSEVFDHKEVTVSGSRISQKVLESPVTIAKLDSKKIFELPQENFYAGLASQKGIDVTTWSLFYQQISMRGPAHPMSEAVLQLTDGMDNTPPGQGFSVGNLAGENDLDIESVDIIPGSASAIYGDNAFSGLINITSKSPFVYRGLSAQVKSGLTYLDGKYHTPALFNDAQVRYAKVWNEKFAVKVSLGYARGTDWLLLDSTDTDPVATEEERGPDNPGRDLFNIYGDEVRQTLTLGTDSEDVSVSRTGYNANDVLGKNTNTLKVRTSLHYRLKKDAELSYLFNYSIFNTNVAPWTWKFREFSVTYHKVELKSRNYFIRAYAIADHDGHSYEAVNVAQLINSRWKSDSAWFNDYESAYNGNIPGILPSDHGTARSYADQGRVLPGSESFNQWLEEFSSVSLHDENGARYEDRTNLQHVHAQYDFSSKIKWMNLIAGTEFRSRNLWSDGTMFLDYPPAHYINTKVYSGYAQGEKKIFHDRLTLLASVRFDKYDFFDLNITPRVAGMFKLKDTHFFRASFQTGTRTPDPFDEYREYNNGFLYWVGGLPLSDEKYNLHQRAFDVNSIYEYSAAASAYIDEFGADSTDAAIKRFKYLLKPAGLEYIHSERVKTIEIGYQCLLFSNKLHVDIDFFGSIYNDLMAYKWVVIPYHGNPYDPDSLKSAAADLIDFSSNSNGFNVPVNANEEVRSGGVEAGLEFNFWKEYIISGNFIYQKSSERNREIDSWLFQTTPIKTNVAISNTKVLKNVGFAINWHWTDAVDHFWGGFNNGHDHLPANSVLDAQVTLRLPKMNSSIRIGASNLLNHYYQNISYGASVGGLYYITILFSGK